jgi:hypothetical protein
MIQVTYNCQFYKNHENLNKTCTQSNKRCELYYTNYCSCFLDKKDKDDATRK